MGPITTTEAAAIGGYGPVEPEIDIDIDIDIGLLENPIDDIDLGKNNFFFFNLFSVS